MAVRDPEFLVYFSPSIDLLDEYSHKVYLRNQLKRMSDSRRLTHFERTVKARLEKHRGKGRLESTFVLGSVSSAIASWTTMVMNRVVRFALQKLRLSALSDTEKVARLARVWDKHIKDVDPTATLKWSLNQWFRECTASKLRESKDGFLNSPTHSSISEFLRLLGVDETKLGSIDLSDRVALFIMYKIRCHAVHRGVHEGHSAAIPLVKAHVAVRYPKKERNDHSDPRIEDSFLNYVAKCPDAVDRKVATYRSSTNANMHNYTLNASSVPLSVKNAEALTIMVNVANIRRMIQSLERLGVAYREVVTQTFP
jgi:hypothetical protein